MIACRVCDAEVVAVELMPRIIAIGGTVDDWLHEPERLDEDDYELSAPVGFGCLRSDCPNWYARVGIETRGGSTVVRGANALADVGIDAPEAA